MIVPSAAPAATAFADDKASDLKNVGTATPSDAGNDTVDTTNISDIDIMDTDILPQETKKQAAKMNAAPKVTRNAEETLSAEVYFNGSGNKEWGRHGCLYRKLGSPS